MIVGVPKEIKADENRVALLPVCAEALVERGHRVLVECEAGISSGALDESYIAAGAEIVTASDVYGQSDLVVKVKEPLPGEYGLLRGGLTLFCYFHFAASEELTCKACARYCKRC